MSNFSNIFLLIPSLNPDNSLIALVNELSNNKWSGIVVVDDGSSQDARKIFNDIRKIKGVNVVSHLENKGKGSALKTGMKYIKNHANNLEGIITVDADGQHLVKDVEKIAALVKERKNDVIFGVRKFKNIPVASMFGNRVMRFLLNIFNGISIDDSQTGLRYLPASIIDDLLVLVGTRYEYELECLFAIKSLGYKITQVQIETVYINDNKGSYFRGFIDSFRVLFVFARFSIVSLSSFGIDALIFVLLLSYFESVFYATIIARIISGVFNFTFNKIFAFRSFGKDKLFRESILYVILWVILAILSAVIVSILEGQPIYAVLLFKMFVDTFLFFLAFYAQKNIVFSRGRRISENLKK